MECRENGFKRIGFQHSWRYGEGEAGFRPKAREHPSFLQLFPRLHEPNGIMNSLWIPSLLTKNIFVPLTLLKVPFYLLGLKRSLPECILKAYLGRNVLVCPRSFDLLYSLPVLINKNPQQSHLYESLEASKSSNIEPIKINSVYKSKMQSSIYSPICS